MWHPALLLLLFLQHSSACEHLTCFADYIQMLMCVWRNISGGALYNLTASWNCGNGGTCYFLPRSRNATQIQYTCFSEQKLCFSNNNFYVKVTKFVDAPLNTFSGCSKTFMFQENIKPHPPFNLTVAASPTGYNISWKTKYQHHPYNYLNDKLQYQLCYRERGHPWQGWRQKHLLQDTRALWLLPQELEGNTEYEFQVRARPAKHSSYLGTWSDWSLPATLVTLPRAPESRETRWLVLLLLPLSLFAALMSFLGWRQRLWKKLNLFIPSPAPFFQPLYLSHNGDFKMWAGTSHSGATLDVFEWGAVMPEVFGIGHKHLPPRPTKGKWRDSPPISPPAASSPHLQASADGPDSTQEQAYGHLSIDTVTVAGEFATCCTHCDQASPCCAPEQLQEKEEEKGEGDAAYRSIPFVGGSSSSCDSLPVHEMRQRSSFPTGSQSWASNTPPAFFPAGGSLGRKFGNNAQFFGLLLEPCALGNPVSISSLQEETHFYSSLLSPDFDADGDPTNSLDLDTIDSGFADCDCGSSVDCESERRRASCGSEPTTVGGEEEREAFLPCYVKQWVSCHNETQSS
ncbi:interleukin-21 receptor [Elgaria multicarinata webbii]|uniref:interleukin-21 receptor n=1 Tax=Elgaria multicarinata webbii TaxID=159646 RepID=UPI002FCD55B4